MNYNRTGILYKRAMQTHVKRDLTGLKQRSNIAYVKLDRNSFKKQSFEAAAEHQSTYNQMSAQERSKSFKYLMQVNYGFLGQDWPKMDRTTFSKRSQG